MAASRQYTFRLPEEVSDAIESIASSEDKSGHQVARELAEEALRRRIDGEPHQPAQPSAGLAAADELRQVIRQELGQLLTEQFDPTRPPWSHLSEILEGLIETMKPGTATLSKSIDEARGELKERLSTVEGELRRLTKHFPKVAELLAELVHGEEANQKDRSQTLSRRPAH